MTAKAPAKGHPAKHATPSKAQAKAKPPPKHAPAKQKKPVTAQAKGTAVHTAAKPAKPAKPAGFALDGLPVCAFEAVAASLRLAGGAVSDEDVLELSWLAGDGEIAPASILTALEAASAFGLAGIRPVNWKPVKPAGMPAILGVPSPGYHAVLATPDGWWSWGALYSPWTARAEEAWEVSWG